VKHAKKICCSGMASLCALVGGAALVGTAPEAAGASTPLTRILVPSSGATVSGSEVVVDSSAPAGLNGFGSIQFLLSSPITPPSVPVVGGPPPFLHDKVVATASRASLYGWITYFNSTTVANGTYLLQSRACIFVGCSAPSPAVTIKVANR
jgi:hypothetical protein